MKNSKSVSKSAKQPAEGTSSQLATLFEDGLKDIYWAENALVKALGKMAKNATSPELIKAVEAHKAETEEHVKRLEQVFSIIGKEPKGKKCEAMDGLIKEGEQIMEEAEEGPMCDTGIIAAAQKVEHYEIATYGTLRTYAQTLNLEDAESLLEETLEEEKATDMALTELSESILGQLVAAEQQTD